MKIASLVKFSTPSAGFEVYPDGSESAALFFGGKKVVSIGRIRTGNFDESLGLAEKLRRHLANDALLAEADSENVIPFGCEYRARRHWKFSGGIVELTDDISADNGGRINDLFLEEIVFTFAPAKIEMILCGEKEIRECPVSGVVYDGEKLPVALKVTGSDGVAAEFYCGDDFWRHNCAAACPGASARHTITVGSDGVHWVRHVLIVPEEVEVENRPWRFKMLAAVGKSSAAVPAAPDAVLEMNGCFAAPARHRELRDFIRKTAGKSAQLKITGELFCEDGSHISRPGKKVLHGMLGELFDDYLWGASVMARKEGNFTIDCRISPWQDSLIAANLGMVPEEISEDEDEI